MEQLRRRKVLRDTDAHDETFLLLLSPLNLKICQSSKIKQQKTKQIHTDLQSLLHHFLCHLPSDLDAKVERLRFSQTENILLLLIHIVRTRVFDSLLYCRFAESCICCKRERLRLRQPKSSAVLVSMIQHLLVVVVVDCNWFFNRLSIDTTHASICRKRKRLRFSQLQKLMMLLLMLMLNRRNNLDN
jgi:hypothetical protein